MRNDLKSNIIVIFNNNKKEELIKAFKTQCKIKPIIATDLYSNFDPTRIYLNDQLSMENKKILWATKQVASKYCYKYVWSNSIGVFLKKKEGDTGTRSCSLVVT
ncbi:uncharacterized protein LOC112692123 [Sipha flava]|uniref:Uncharacterized protein LOC112692123 n=1 Tax=Sipha flava TaxID=143950 RepID=A0A8B8GIZ4_9HEMI|nr:uncharacterized protein LOC112692123 [Sipha flava]